MPKLNDILLEAIKEKYLSLDSEEEKREILKQVCKRQAWGKNAFSFFEPQLAKEKAVRLLAAGLGKYLLYGEWERDQMNYCIKLYFSPCEIDKEIFKQINKVLTENINQALGNSFIGGNTLAFQAMEVMREYTVIVNKIIINTQTLHHVWPGEKEKLRAHLYHAIEILYKQGLLFLEDIQNIKEHLGISKIPALQILALRKVQEHIGIGKDLSVKELEDKHYPEMLTRRINGPGF